MSWRTRLHHRIPSKPFLFILKFEQLYIAKHVQMFSNLVHMLQWSNHAPRPNGTGWRKRYLDQSASKPSLTRIKFELLCTTNFFSMTPTLVSLITWPNKATTPSGASRRSDLLNWIYTSPFLPIFRVYKSCIGNFAQISSKWVEGPNYVWHLTQWSLMASGSH